MKPMHYSEPWSEPAEPKIDWTAVGIIACVILICVAAWAFAIFGASQALR